MKVWLYYRLSRDEYEELNSLNNQRKIIYNFAVSNGHEVVGESFDDNVSGMHFNREGIDKIYEVVEAGKVRKLEFDFNVVSYGALARRLNGMEIGAEIQFKGFLAPKSMRTRRLTVHITEFK